MLWVYPFCTQGLRRGLGIIARLQPQ